MFVCRTIVLYEFYDELMICSTLVFISMLLL